MAKLALLGGERTVTKPFVQWPVIDESDIEAVSGVIRSGKWFRHDGEENVKFEEVFAAYCGVKKGLTVTNGTAALEISLAALGVGPGDEVIVPSYTFNSTASAVLFIGATPVFCDIDPENYNINLDEVERLITPRTRAIIPVHFAGLPVDMDRLNQIAVRHGIAVIEDAAHAHGTRYKGRMAGSLARAAAFSFQASKNLTSGEGGMILTDDVSLYESMYSRHTCGRKLGRPWYEHHSVASNLRLTEMQAALLLRQIARLEEQTAERAENARLIRSMLEGSPSIRLVQREESWSTRRAWHIFIIQYDPGIEGVSRGRFIEALQAEGLPVSGGYPMPLYRQPVFGSVRLPEAQAVPYVELNQPGAERCCGTTVWIPQHCLLGGPENGIKVVDALTKVLEHADELRRLG